MKLKFRTKLTLALVVCTVALGSLMGGISLYRQWNSSQAIIADSRKNLYDNFDKNARNQVENAGSLLQQVYDQSTKSGATIEEAKKTGADLLRNLKYDKDGYFWADTTEGINVVYLGKPVEGKSRIDLLDKKNNQFIKNIIDNGKKPGGGYTDYWFPKPGSDDPSPKRSYSLEFKPFGWVIGTGNYVDDIETILSKTVASERKILINTIILYAVITVISLLAATILSLLYSSYMLKELGGEPADITDMASRIAAGDLSTTYDQSKASTGIHAAMIVMATKLQSLVGEITRSSHDVSAAAEQVSVTAGRIATGSEEVAAQTATVATAGEEMSATSNDIAHNCLMAAEGATRAAHTATAGTEIVNATIAAMGKINSTVQSSAKAVINLGVRSEQIGQIIGTIEDIADQTNLLALNAAIEAARAGEQGRGFAVVADEVRALAERTTRATKEISEMIKAIQVETHAAVGGMETGVRLVEEGTNEAAKSGVALNEILEQINAVAMQVSQIATAAEEQTATTSEISNNMMQITEVVHQTSRGSHESAAAALQLHGYADALQGMVRQFRM